MKQSQTLRRFGNIVVHSALIILPLFLLAGFAVGTTTVKDVNTASAALSLGFVIYFQYMSNQQYEPSALSYLVLILLGLGSLVWVWGFEVTHYHGFGHALLASLIRFGVLVLFILSIELATGDLPQAIARVLPERIRPEIPQEAFIRERYSQLTTERHD